MMTKTPKLPKDVVQPALLGRLLGIEYSTRWKWEQSGRIPPRDFYLNDRPIGWRPQTVLEMLERRGVA